MDHIQHSFNNTTVQGYMTPEEAVRAYEADIRRTAVPSSRLEQKAGKVVFDKMTNLLAPSRTFQTTVSRSVKFDSGTVYFFDKPSDSNGVLEARVVVGKVEERWVVLEAFRCASTIVSDWDQFKELRTQEVSK